MGIKNKVILYIYLEADHKGDEDDDDVACLGVDEVKKTFGSKLTDEFGV